MVSGEWVVGNDFFPTRHFLLSTPYIHYKRSLISYVVERNACSLAVAFPLRRKAG